MQESEIMKARLQALQKQKKLKKVEEPTLSRQAGPGVEIFPRLPKPLTRQAGPGVSIASKPKSTLSRQAGPGVSIRPQAPAAAAPAPAPKPKPKPKEEPPRRERPERRGREPSRGGPIIVQGAGGGGASSSSGGAAGGSAAAGPGGGPAARAPDLSKVVEAMKQIAEGAKKKGGGSNKGISQARRAYTDKRKSKIAELRALKSKRIREFNAKTKKLPKADRDKQRREYKKRVEAQFKEMQTRFPTARGLKSVGVLRELIRKLDAFRAAR